jgi:DNA processing protein
MVLDPRSLQWATLAHKSLPQRALVTLLREFQDPGAILAASPAQLSRHVPANVAAAVLAPVDENALEATARWIDDAEHHVVAWDDTDYPQALLDIGHAPPVIFFVGRRALLNRPALAIVGSRHATPQGQANAREFAKALAAANLTIVSGLALGIDAAAHEGALGTDASTLAVIGTGADRIYPAGNRDLARRIAQTGGILSEFVPGTPARKENFPRRNRLISGLARGVLVVEATLSSGSLITGALGGRAGPRSVRDSRLDPLAVRQGLSQADSRRRQAGGNGAGCPRRARHRHARARVARERNAMRQHPNPRCLR